MTLRSQAHALIGRFIADIDGIIREHAKRATQRALADRGLVASRAKRLGQPAPLKLAPPEQPATKRRKQAQPAKKAKAGRVSKARRGRTQAQAKQLALF